MKYNTEIRTNVSGNTDSISLEPGLWNIFATASNWASGTATLQTSHDNSIFMNLKDSSNNNVAFTSNGVVELNGGLYLRSSNNANISGFFLVAKISSYL